MNAVDIMAVTESNGQVFITMYLLFATRNGVPRFPLIGRLSDLLRTNSKI